MKYNESNCKQSNTDPLFRCYCIDLYYFKVLMCVVDENIIIKCVMDKRVRFEANSYFIRFNVLFY
jgi:hypothetical protein